MKKKMIHMIVLAMACLFASCQDSSKLVISDLQCEYLNAPLAIDNTTPHFGWKMTCGQNGTSSSAYQILVATELDKLNEEEALKDQKYEGKQPDHAHDHKEGMGDYIGSKALCLQ